MRLFVAWVSMLLAVAWSCAPTAQAAPAGWRAKTWSGISLAVPPTWQEGDQSSGQGSWNFGDLAGGRFGFVGLYLARQSPEAMTPEAGARLVKLGPATLMGRQAQSYDLIFAAGPKQYRLYYFAEPDANGDRLLVMAGVVGLDFAANWPVIQQVLGTMARTKAAAQTGDPFPMTAPTGDGGDAAPAAPTQTAQTPASGGGAGGGVIPGLGQGQVPSGWSTKTWEGVQFAVPADWQNVEPRSEGASWGKVDKATRKGVMFGIIVERKPFTIDKDERNMKLRDLGPITVLGQPAKVLEATGSPAPGVQVKMLLVALDAPTAKGRYIAFTAGVVGLPWDQHWPTIQKAFASLSGQIELAAPPAGAVPGTGGAPPSSTGDGASAGPSAAGDAWGLVSLPVPAGWKTMSDAEGKVWASNIATEPDASVTVMKGEKLLKVLSTMRIDSVTPGYAGGQQGSVIRGKVDFYAQPVDLWLVHKCPAQGQMLAVVVGGRDQAKHKAALAQMLGGLRFTLPADAKDFNQNVQVSHLGVTLTIPYGWKCGKYNDGIGCQGFDLDRKAAMTVSAILENTPYVKGAGTYKDKLDKRGVVSISGRPATDYATVIDGGSGPKYSRVIAVDQPLASGKYLYIQFQRPDGGDWQALAGWMDYVLSTVSLDQPGQAATTPVAPPIQPAPTATTVQRTPTTPAQTPPTAPAVVQGQPPAGVAATLVLRHTVADFVAADDKPGPNGSPDTVLRLTITAPGRALAALSLGAPGGRAAWDTTAGNGIWLLGLGQKRRLLNGPDGSLRVTLGQGAEVFDVYVQDNNSIAGGKPLELTIVFADGSTLTTPLQR